MQERNVLFFQEMEEVPSFVLLKSVINVLSKIWEFLIYKRYTGFKVSFLSLEI